MSGARWSSTQKAEAIALAMAVGSVEAAKQLGIPRRTISSWLGGDRDVGPDVKAAIISSRAQLAERMQEVLTLATEQVLAGLRDPKSRLGERVQAMAMALEAARFLGAEASGALSDVSDDEALMLEDWVRRHADEIEAGERELALGPGEES